jgi:hypothetical protein
VTALGASQVAIKVLTVVSDSPEVMNRVSKPVTHGNSYQSLVESAPRAGGSGPFKVQSEHCADVWVRTGRNIWSLLCTCVACTCFFGSLAFRSESRFGSGIQMATQQRFSESMANI